eukprot:1034008-Amphidinium_carterae.5
MKYIPKVCSENFHLKLTKNTQNIEMLETQTEKTERDRGPRDDEVLEVFTIMKEDYVTEWITKGTLPSHNITDHTDVRQGSSNFHMKVECTVNEYLNNCWKNDPREVPL